MHTSFKLTSIDKIIYCKMIIKNEQKSLIVKQEINAF